MSYFINHLDGRIDHADTLEQTIEILRVTYGSEAVMSEGTPAFTAEQGLEYLRCGYGKWVYAERPATTTRFIVWPSQEDAEYDDGKMAVAIVEHVET